MTSRALAAEKLDGIVKLLQQPGGYAKLSAQQRKFIYGVLLAMVVPADMNVRKAEISRLTELLGKVLQLTGDKAATSLSLAELPQDAQLHVDILAKAMQELLGAEDRAQFVRHLWDLALCDGELHDLEDRLIFRIADRSGLPRKLVAEQLAKASAQIS